MNIIEKIKQNPNLYKHSATIHITNKISLLQRKLYNVLLKNAFDEMEKNNNHEILVSDLCKVVGFNSNNTKSLKDALTRLRETGIDVNVLGKDNKNNWTNIGLCSRVQIDEKTGMCCYGFDSEFVKIFKNPNIFASLNLDIQQKFKSKHAIAIWEFCIEDISTKKCDLSNTKFISIEDFKKMLYLKSDQYKEYKFLNQFVLKPAIKEISEKSDITIKLNDPKRENRKVSHISFFVERKNKTKEVKVTTFEEDLEIAKENYKKNKKSSILETQQENIIEAEFEEITPIKEEVVLKQQQKSEQEQQSQEEYPFTLTSIKTLISIGVSKESIKDQFKKISLEFGKENTEILFTNFLQENEIKIAMNKQTTPNGEILGSVSGFIFNKIIKRSYFTKETLEKIINQKEQKTQKEQEKENLAEKYKIRNDNVFWLVTKKLLEVERRQHNFPTYLKLENINFSFIDQENNTAYLLISKSVENPKFQRDNFLKQKNKIIEIMKKAENSVKDLKISIDGEYQFF